MAPPVHFIMYKIASVWPRTVLALTFSRSHPVVIMTKLYISLIDQYLLISSHIQYPYISTNQTAADLYPDF